MLIFIAVGLMSGFLLFSISILVVVCASILIYVKKPKKLLDKEGRGILTGVALAIAIPLLIALASFLLSPKANALEYLTRAEIYAGLESTRKMSPMCEFGENTDRLTSNLGFRATLVESSDKKARVMVNYTHHSCAFNEDAKSYDAVGVQIIYVIF